MSQLRVTAKQSQCEATRLSSNLNTTSTTSTTMRSVLDILSDVGYVALRRAPPVLDLDNSVIRRVHRLAHKDRSCLADTGRAFVYWYIVRLLMVHVPPELLCSSLITRIRNRILEPETLNFLASHIFDSTQLAAISPCQLMLAYIAGLYYKGNKLSAVFLPLGTLFGHLGEELYQRSLAFKRRLRGLNPIPTEELDAASIRDPDGVALALHARYMQQRIAASRIQTPPDSKFATDFETFRLLDDIRRCQKSPTRRPGTTAKENILGTSSRHAIPASPRGRPPLVHRNTQHYYRH
ncbi:hypothetical protein C8R46DRAFT_1087302 [Mycena filopes]|nr:hypothetical protein C8R46DRAFT_1087302 [Mycena filopes]